MNETKRSSVGVVSVEGGGRPSRPAAPIYKCMKRNESKIITRVLRARCVVICLFVILPCYFILFVVLFCYFIVFVVLFCCFILFVILFKPNRPEAPPGGKGGGNKKEPFQQK